jgi:hypothetical protein
MICKFFHIQKKEHPNFYQSLITEDSKQTFQVACQKAYQISALCMSLPKEKYHMSDPLLLQYPQVQRLLPIPTRTTKQAIILIIINMVHIPCVTIILKVCFCNSSSILFYHCISWLLSSLK